MAGAKPKKSKRIKELIIKQSQPKEEKISIEGINTAPGANDKNLEPTILLKVKYLVVLLKKHTDRAFKTFFINIF